MRRHRIPLLTLVILTALSALCAFSVRLAAGRTLAQVQEMIRDQKLPWQAGHTSLSDVPWTEFRERLTFRLPPGYAALPKVDLSRHLSKAGALPSAWDWRDHHGVSPVKD